MPNVAFKRKEVKDAADKWGVVRDCIAGEKQIKHRKEKYLPCPDATNNATEREKRYRSYMTRANFYNVTGRTLNGLVGQVYSKDPSIELPSEIELFENDVDGAGMTATQMSKSVLADILSVGRGGLLADFPSVPEGKVITLADLQSGRFRPRVIFIPAEKIINWRESNYGGETFLSLVVIEEEKVVSDDGFEFKTEPRWRVLRLENGAVTVTIYKENEGLRGQSREKYVIDPEDGGPFILKDYAGRPFNRIPFEFVGAENNDATVDESPLYALSSINIAHYQVNADWREMLFLAGQGTLILAGIKESWADKYLKDGVYLGSRQGILLNEGASAQLLQLEANEILGAALTKLEDQMKALGAKLIEPGQVKGTATEAAIEEASESSVLSSAAKNVSQAFEKIFFHASKWLGEVDEDKITFELNTEFDVARMTPQERQQLLAEWQGELITFGEAREQLRKKGIAFEDDKEARKIIEGEAGDRLGMQQNPQNLPDDLNPDGTPKQQPGAA